MRYILFAFDGYYPGGGANDIYGTYEFLGTAIEHGYRVNYDMWHIYDVIEGEIVYDSLTSN